jgi:hypothetical protein
MITYFMTGLLLLGMAIYRLIQVCCSRTDPRWNSHQLGSSPLYGLLGKRFALGWPRSMLAQVIGLLSVAIAVAGRIAVELGASKEVLAAMNVASLSGVLTGGCCGILTIWLGKPEVLIPVRLRLRD